MQWLPTADYLHECFDYDPDTGVLTWKTRPLHHFAREVAQRQWNTRFAGRPVGTPNRDGHIRFPLRRDHQFTAHRIIWFMVMGKWPERLDHKNGDPSDNRWENLREANVQQNTWNRRHTGSLPKGVHPTRYGRRYWARLCVTKPDGNRTIKHLGTFDTPEEAHAAWAAAALQQRGEFFRPE